MELIQKELMRVINKTNHEADVITKNKTSKTLELNEETLKLLEDVKYELKYQAFCCY